MNIKNRIRILDGILDCSEEAYESLIHFCALIFNKIPVYSEDSYCDAYLPLRVDTLKFALGLEPDLNVGIALDDDEVFVNIFVVASLMQAAEVNNVTEMLLNNEVLSAEEVTYLITNSGKEIVSNLCNYWDECKKLKKHGMWKIKANEQWYYFLVETGLQFIIWHEYAHWNIERFNKTFCAKIFSQTEKYLEDFIKLYQGKNYIPDEELQSISLMMQEQDIKKNWIEEITADMMSVMACLTKANSNVQEERSLYISFANIYGVLKLYEQYRVNFKKRYVITETHPPAQFREMMIQYMLAGENNMSLKDFIQYKYGANYVMRKYWDKIIEEQKYVTWH